MDTLNLHNVMVIMSQLVWMEKTKIRNFEVNHEKEEQQTDIDIKSWF